MDPCLVMPQQLTLGILQLKVNHLKISSNNHLLKQYPNVFKGIGNLSGLYRSHASH